MEDICVIDDDETTRSSIARLIKPLGVTIYEFARGDAFLGQLDQLQPRCLISEFNLPDMTGVELLQKLRQRPSWFPTIFVTDRDDVGSAVSAMRAGAVDYIQKSRHHYVLFARVQQILYE
jgi:two-component system response regulator FixJ